VLFLADALELTPEERAALIDAATRASKANWVQPEGAPVVPVPPGMRHNLPPPLTSFVGRERDLADVRRCLSEARLVTLTGPGGVGKTRLALEVTGQLARSGGPTYAAGIWRVELAPLVDGALVPRAMASVLGVQEVPGQPLGESVLRWLHARELLLILDNCEHLAAACGAVASALLEACPGLTILATSREALNVAGEVVWPVGPLEADSDGLQMFAVLAALASPAFRLTSDTRSAVIRVCQRLDGLPLAIELAAARVNALSVEEIEQRLDQRFALLTAGRRSSPPRHQTLRALVDWSYELLTAEEHSLFQQLSVFSGGWTLEAADAVCEPAADVLALLVSLVDKSLVQVERQAGQSRYRLLETLRQYAADKLREAQLAIDRGDLALAYDLLAESLVVAREWGKAGWGVAPALANLAELAMADGRGERLGGGTRYDPRPSSGVRTRKAIDRRSDRADTEPEVARDRRGPARWPTRHEPRDRGSSRHQQTHRQAAHGEQSIETVRGDRRLNETMSLSLASTSPRTSFESRL
jgi:predicted ATPase